MLKFVQAGKKLNLTRFLSQILNYHEKKILKKAIPRV